ncbi:unannotated protein [freshwater metagenome]|uniref:Unannotated protein n=1 Tax=freshwater metagenome TaxID=449393 RepID=A0A6J7GUR3_9ZZZZ|nr:hypothetical protein [Actinomycetota bacterium]
MQYGYDVTGSSADEIAVAAADGARAFAGDTWQVDDVRIVVSAQARTTEGRVLSYLGECTARLSPAPNVDDPTDA